MWLLDANMPVQLVGLLSELGIEADSAWRALEHAQQWQLGERCGAGEVCCSSYA